MFHIADAEIAEALIWHLWQDRLPATRPLKLIDGRTVRIYKTGQLNHDSGPDFLDAALSFGPGSPITGDVEIHVRPVDWRRHGHDQDARYNSVVLHVVMWDDAACGPVLKQNGQYVPTLVLSEHLKVSLDAIRQRADRGRIPDYPCQKMTSASSVQTIKTALYQAAQIRFLRKVEAIEKRMRYVSPEQTLFESLMRTAGYSKNADAFATLARHMPIALLRTALCDVPASEQTGHVQAILFGAAGWMRHRGHGWHREDRPENPDLIDIDAIWGRMEPALDIQPMETTEWQFFRLRPANFPTVRLAGMSYLARAGLQTPLNDPFRRACEAGSPPRQILQALRATLDRLLKPDEDDYFLSHFLPGGPEHKSRAALIGTERRGDMMVNAILPFLFANARRESNDRLAQTIRGVCDIHPRLPENEKIRSMKALIFQDAAARSPCIDNAAMQQGLLHIEETTCREKACGACPLNHYTRMKDEER